MLKVTSRIVKAELERRSVRVEVITEAPVALMRYFHNDKWHLLHSTLPEFSTGVGRVICDQKYVSTALAKLNGIPVPETVAYSDMDSAIEFMKRRGRIVVKPADSAHGSGITVGVKGENQLRRALELAQASALNGTVLLQQMVSGSDLRILVIGGKYAATARRIPAEVIGDGERTLRQLIEHENATNPERGVNDEKRLAIIDMNAAERFLGDRLDSEVPVNGKLVTVVGTANIGAGGRAVDYTDKITPELIEAAEKFARAVKVAACGVDFMWDEETSEFYFIEGNATPGFCLHIEPSEGESHRVDEKFVDFILAQPDHEWQQAPSEPKR